MLQHCLLQLKKNINASSCAMYLWSQVYFITMLYKICQLKACSFACGAYQTFCTHAEMFMQQPQFCIFLCLQTWTRCLGKGRCSLQADAC